MDRTDPIPRDLRIGTIALDEGRRCVSVSPQGAALLGIADQQVAGRSLTECLPAPLGETIDEFCERLDQPDSPQEIRVPHPSTRRWLRIRIRRTPEPLTLLVDDITELRALEEALDRQRVIFDTLSDAVIVTDPDGRITGWNPAAERVLGYEADEIIGQTPAVFLHGRVEQMTDILQKVADGGHWTGETAVRRKNGERRLLEIRVRPIHDGDGEFVGTVGVCTDLTEQRQTENELNALFGAMADPVFVIDREGRHLSVASSGRDLLYLDPDEIVGRTILELMPEEIGTRLQQAVERALDEGRKVEVEYPLAVRGSARRYLATVSPIDDDRVLWVARDITKRFESERRLRENTEQLRTFLDAIPDHAWMKGLDGRYLVANEAYLKAWNRRLDEVAGKTDEDLFPPDVAEEFAVSDRQVVETGSRLSFEHRMDVPGASGWFEVIKAPLLDGDGEVQAVVGISHDITGRKQTEEALRETESRFLQLAENIPEVFWMRNTSERHALYVSPAFESIWGESPSVVEESVDGWLGSIHPEDRNRVRETFERTTVSGEPWELRYRIIRKDGEIRWIHDRAFPIEDDIGEVHRFAGVAMDITEQRAVEVQLERQALLFQATNEAVIYVDLPGRITEWNPGATKIFGYTPEEAVGSSLQALLDPSAPNDAAIQYFDILRRDRIWMGERSGVRRDGSVAICEVVMLPVFQRGELDGAIVIARDITERRSLEEQLRQSQKLEGIGRLAGGIAHDFNNMLLAIQGFATLLGDEIPRGGSADDYLHEIHRAVERSTRLTSQLLAYSRRQILRTEVIDLNRVAAGLESMLHRMIGEDVVLTLDLDPQPLSIEADRSQIEQVLINLAVNARDAMLRGGELGISTRRIVVEEDSPMSGQVPVGRYAEISVSDTGVGMSPDVLAVAFEPFFTTKRTGEGTGLGLSMVYGIVKQSGGHIRPESAPGEGTTFRILLPLLDQAAEPEEDEDTGPIQLEKRPNSGRVLVVEDEPGVRRLLKLILEKAGFEVVAAASSSEANAALEEFGNSFDTALIDVVLRGESGRVVADGVRAACPDCPIVFMSGYTDDQLLRHGIRQSEHLFLQKPIKPDLLIETVRELVG